MSITGFLLTFITSTALGQDTIDIGTLKTKDVKVVQKVLYPKKGMQELGGHFGLMPFDAYTFTPKLEFTYAKHLSEKLAWEVALGGGYGLRNGTFKVLEGPSYGITPDAYRYLGSVTTDIQWAPIYAKMSWDGQKVLHHDFYALAGAGVTIEQAFMEDKSMAFAPALALGFGARVFLPNNAAIRIQLRDDILFQPRAKTVESQSFYLKQNTSISVGYVLLSK